LPKALGESLLILFAVVLGFLANDWRESRNERRDARVALERVVEEMEANVEQLRDVVGYHEGIADAAAGLLAEIEAGESPTRGTLIDRVTASMPQGIRPPLLRDVAWRYASDRGDLDTICYPLIAQVAMVYEVQELGAGSTWRRIAEAFFFNEESFVETELSGKLFYMNLAFIELYRQELGLIGEYENILPLVRAELAKSPDSPCRDSR
jgi:hypothetical protein